MTLEQLRKKKARYDTAIESLTELIEKKDEGFTIEMIRDYLIQNGSRAEKNYLAQRELNEMQVIDVDCVTGNQ